MEHVQRRLEEGRNRLRRFDHSSFYLWRQKLQRFMAQTEGKIEHQALAASDREEIEVMALRNLVETEKVEEYLLREQLQMTAEWAHSTLSTLRAECKWWRNRDRHLRAQMQLRGSS